LIVVLVLAFVAGLVVLIVCFVKKSRAREREAAELLAMNGTD
jgi:flagellar basal body-associated protein FliL